MCNLYDMSVNYSTRIFEDLGIDTALKRAILDTRIAPKYIEVLKNYGFNEDGLFSVLVFGRVGEKSRITDCLYVFGKLFHVVKYKNNYIAVIEKDFSVNDSFEGINCKVGVSSVQKGIKSLAKLYKQAMSSLRAAYILDEDVMLYDDTSILSVILAIEDKELLSHFYKKRLSGLESYDNENDSDLVETLFCYLKADKVLTEGARLMQVNEGEMGERMDSIRKICGKEFNCADEKYEYLTAIYVKKSLEEVIEI